MGFGHIQIHFMLHTLIVCVGCSPDTLYTDMCTNCYSWIARLFLCSHPKDQWDSNFDRIHCKKLQRHAFIRQQIYADIFWLNSSAWIRPLFTFLFFSIWFFFRFFLSIIIYAHFFSCGILWWGYYRIFRSTRSKHFILNRLNYLIC